MALFVIKLKTSLGETIEALEGAVRRADQVGKMLGGRNDDLSRAWAESRQEMFATRGGSIGAPWRPYTASEKRYYLPRKRAALYGSNRGESGRAHRIGNDNLLRFTTAPQSIAPGPLERLYPGMTSVRHPEYVWEQTANSVTMGTAVPYAVDHDRGGVQVTFRSNYGRGKTATRVRYMLPQRRLILFGATFIESVRRRMAAFAVQGGGRKNVGLTTSELFNRLARVSVPAAGGSVAL